MSSIKRKKPVRRSSKVVRRKRVERGIVVPVDALELFEAAERAGHFAMSSAMTLVAANFVKTKSKNKNRQIEEAVELMVHGLMRICQQESNRGGK